MAEKQSENKSEIIGFHKGAVSTLAKERMELLKMVGITEQLMQAHMKALQDLGVDLEKEAKEAMDKMKKEKKTDLDKRIG